MHLDTVFTRISTGECSLLRADDPVRAAPRRRDVYEVDLTAREITWTSRDDLLSALAALGASISS